MDFLKIGRNEYVDENNEYYIADSLDDAKQQYRMKNKYPTSEIMRDTFSWREAVYERDNYTCQVCGSTKKIHAHHKYGQTRFPEYQFHVDNGITLCQECHVAIHARRNKYYRKHNGDVHNDDVRINKKKVSSGKTLADFYPYIGGE